MEQDSFLSDGTFDRLTELSDDFSDTMPEAPRTRGRNESFSDFIARGREALLEEDGSFVRSLFED